MPSADRMRRENVLLFTNPRAYSSHKMWSHWALREVWVKACKAAKVPYVSPYPATKHTTATKLATEGAPLSALQTLLGHKDRKSTERYIVFSGRDAQNMIREWALR